LKKLFIQGEKKVPNRWLGSHEHTAVI